jgi:small-conductance mechanosensitive channel
MPNLSTELGGLVDWLSANALPLFVGAVILLFLYRRLRPWIHRLLVGAMNAQRAAVGDDVAEQEELDRRVATIEELATKILKGAVVAGIVSLLLGFFNLWGALAGLGLVLAAITFAGQGIILDFLMGLLILVEGQYFKGDTVVIEGVQGIVEEVGLRRTTIRDARGTLHSISNGVIRQSANLTRTYAAATVEVDGVADADVETVIGVLDEVGRSLASDPQFEGILLDVPGYGGATRLTASGSTLRLRGRVRPDARIQVEAEMRRRIAGALAAAGVRLIHPGSSYAAAAPR